MPRSIESELIIDNMSFNTAFNDKNSTEYKKFTSGLEEILLTTLFDQGTLNYGAAKIFLKIIDIRCELQL